MALKKPIVLETTNADLWSNFQTADTLDVDGSLTVNESGGDKDTRIEGDTATSLFVCDAGLDAVQIGTTTAGVIADFRSAIIVFNENGADRDFRVEGDNATSLFVTDAGLDAVQIGGTTAGTIADFRSTIVVFNESGNDQDFRVEGDTSPQLFVCDAGTNSVKVGLTNAGELMNLTSTIAHFNELGADIDFKVSGSALGSPAAFVIDAGLGAVRFGTVVDGDIFDARNGFWVINEAGNDLDTRIEGDSLAYMFFTEGNASSENIAMLTTAAPNWQSMDRGIFIGNTATAPTGNPTDGIFMWGEGNELNIRNPAGTVVDLFSGGGGASSVFVNNFRLGLTSGDPTADATGASTIYLTPFTGNQIALYNGSSWDLLSSAQVSLALSGLTSGAVYDVFAYNNAGTLTLELGDAWTNTNTRATAITRQDGVYCESGNLTRRYIGTIRTVSTSTTTSSTSLRYVYNYYNRLPLVCSFNSGDVTGTYTSSTPQRVNNADTNVRVLVGVANEHVATMFGAEFCSVTAGTNGQFTVGFRTDSTSADVILGNYNGVTISANLIWLSETLSQGLVLGVSHPNVYHRAFTSTISFQFYGFNCCVNM